MIRLLGCIALALCLFASGLPAAQLIHHDLQVRLEPDEGKLSVTDSLRFEQPGGRQIFYLHDGLDPKVLAGNARLLGLGKQGDIARYALLLEAGEHSVKLAYGGRIVHPLQEIKESLGKSHQRSSGSISTQGVFLDGSAPWYPWVPDSLQTFAMQVDLPADWLAVSQGAGPEQGRSGARMRVRWRESNPQDDIYLIAAPFRLYRDQNPQAEAQVWLRQPDTDLANRYLGLTREYLSLYEQLIGPYPYAKFALVENFWESGYGMPSFTLLGPRVIRLPFIAYTSYPHEILHNWWGNGVYVDFASGNWSEGLTSYLADHLFKERRGQAAAYRRDALKAYADFVHSGKDFPLRQFRSRHSSASQSVGYGKGLMFFHMLRRTLGDQAFIDGLRTFYSAQRFRTAGFDDLRQAFEQVSGLDLSAYFDTWLERTGAPRLALQDVRMETRGEQFILRGEVHQTQDEAAYPLQLPLLVHLADGTLYEHKLPMRQRQAAFELTLNARPLRLDLDPRFDLFRRLYPQESPPSLSGLFGAEQGLILLPSAAPPPLRKAYAQLARQWTRGHDDWKIRQDSAVEQLPADRPVWLLGWENRFLPELSARWQDQGVNLSDADIRLPGQAFKREAHSLVLTAAGKQPDGPPRAWLGAHHAAALKGLARKLPHYGKYGMLVFSGEAPHNLLKEQWPVTDSPLTVPLAPGAETLDVPPRAAL